MSGMEQIGRVLVLSGGLLLFLGITLILMARIPFLGRLPGDFLVQRDNVTIYVPLVTMILVSILLTVVLNLFFLRR